MSQLISRLTNWTLIALAFLMPIWFLPLAADSFGPQKQMLLVSVAGVLTLLWIARTIINKRVFITFSPISVAAILLSVAVFASAVLAPNTPFQLSERFMSLVAMTLIVLVGPTLTTQLRWKQLQLALTASGVVLSVLIWWQMLPWSFSELMNRFVGTSFAEGVTFTLAESPAVLLGFLLPLIVANAVTLWRHGKTTKDSQRRWMIEGILTLILVVSVLGYVVALIRNPEARPVLLPYGIGWGIAVENFKRIQHFLFGLGPEQFLVAFHRFRDVSINTTDLWSLRFRASSSEALHALTTLGIIGLGAWVALLGSAAWVSRHFFKTQPALAAFLLLQIVLFFVMPFNVVTLGLLSLTLLAVIQEARQEHAASAYDLIIVLSAIQLAPSGHIKNKRTHAGFALGAALVALGALLVSGYFAGRVFAARLYYWQSLQAAQNNEATRAYTLQQRTIRLHPFNTQYRRTYSLTNLAIARALAQNPQDLTEEERATFAQLLQQSIREARLAAQINPTETENWEHLGTLYSNLLDVEGSSRWAAASFIQAIQTDPIAPQLRTQLGNLYMQLEQPDQSLRYFEQAIQLKPDWHIPYYRYGVALMDLEQYALAQTVLERALALIEPDNNDYTVIQNTLQQATTEAAAAATTPAEQTETQGPAPSELPSDPNQQPTLPETPESQPGFEQLLQEEEPATGNPNPTPSAEATSPEGEPNNGSIVLPESVGF